MHGLKRAVVEYNVPSHIPPRKLQLGSCLKRKSIAAIVWYTTKYTNDKTSMFAFLCGFFTTDARTKREKAALSSRYNLDADSCCGQTSWHHSQLRIQRCSRRFCLPLLRRLTHTWLVAVNVIPQTYNSLLSWAYYNVKWVRLPSVLCSQHADILQTDSQGTNISDISLQASQHSGFFYCNLWCSNSVNVVVSNEFLLCLYLHEKFLKFKNCT